MAATGRVITWKEYFGTIALLAHHHSETEPGGGACLIGDDNNLVSIGYTRKRLKNTESYTHAIKDALLNAQQLGRSAKGIVLYTTQYPCPHCAQDIAQRGITWIGVVNPKINSDIINACMVASDQGWGDMFKTKPRGDRLVSELRVASRQLFVNAKIPVNEPVFKMELTFPHPEIFPHLKSSDNFLQAVALLAEKRSKDPATDVGAVIVDRTKHGDIILGIGYNGMPMGCSDKDMHWNNLDEKIKEEAYKCKHAYVCHAEKNAISFSDLAYYTKDNADLEMFVTLIPCAFCSHAIEEAGIKLREKCYYERENDEKKREKNATEVMILKIKYPTEQSEADIYKFEMLKKKEWATVSKLPQ